MKSGAWKWILLLAVAAVPWLAGRAHPFLYDDLGMIAENSFLEEPANLLRVVTGRTLADPQVVNGRRPVVLASYFLDRALHGLAPTGWRMTSLALHLGCAAWLAGLLLRLGGSRFFAAAAGLLFALHPAATEAVHAPGFRADVLCLFFSLAALHGFLGSGTRLRRGGALACLVLALLAKETALATPVLLGGLMLLFPSAFPGPWRKRLTGLAAAGAVAAIFFVLWALLPAELQAAGRSWNGESLRWPQNIFSMPALWTRTLRLLLVPWPLNVTPAFEPVASAGTLRFAVGLAWLAGCGWAAWRVRRAAPMVALGFFWMLALFLPVANLFPLLHPVADRYLYPVIPGFAVLAGWLLAQQVRTSRAFGLAALAAVYALLLTWRIGQWSSAEKLWTAAYFQNPKSATAATWLGWLREEAGDVTGARAFYQAAVEANPQADVAWVNWSSLEGRAENWAEAERLARRAVEVCPEGSLGWHNLAVSLASQGREPEAAAAAARAAELKAD